MHVNVSYALLNGRRITEVEASAKLSLTLVRDDTDEVTITGMKAHEQKRVH